MKKSLHNFILGGIALLVVSGLAPGSARPQAEDAGPPTASVEQLTWLSGSWQGTLGRAQIEEHWTPVAGGTLLGVSRTIVGEKTVAFEFLRIETRPDGLYYVAQPNGRPGTAFKLTRLQGQEAVFENPAHDHPKLISYRKNPDGSLLARVEGDEEGKHVAQEFLFRPVSKK